MSETTFQLANAIKYFKGEPQQVEAIAILDEAIASKGEIDSGTLSQAIAVWRSKPKATELISKGQADFIFGNQIRDDELADLNNCLVRFEISAPPRIRHFLAQIAHESGGLKWLKELASGDDYEWRGDLGNNQPGDGRRFKGAGAIQLTGRANYQAFADFMGDPRVMEGCDYVASTYPFSSAGWFWMRNSINEAIDNGADIYAVTRIINGGLNGIDDRIFYYNLASENI